MAGRRARTEEFSISGDRIGAAARALFRGIWDRRVALKTRAGRRLLRVPLILALAAVLLLPLLVLLGAALSLAVGLRITFERYEEAPSGAASDPGRP